MSTGSKIFVRQQPFRGRAVRPSMDVAGEVQDLRNDIKDEFKHSPLMIVEEFTNLPASDDDAIKASVASVATATTYSGAALDGVIGGGTISPPRNILITTAGVTPADAPATAVITGLDVNGDVLTESIAVAQTATTAAGTKCFAKVTSIALTAGDGTAATLKFGTGAVVGLARKVKSRTGAAAVITEWMDGAAVGTAGVFGLPATNLPNGGYTPNTAPNGTHDYCLYYEEDLGLNTTQ